MVPIDVLYVLLTLSYVTAESPTSSVSVEEGDAVTLRCVFPGGHGSDIQLLTPRGYTSYFNGEKVLKDRRYELVRSSRNKMVVRLSNVTGADEGVYACLYYSSPVQTKRVRLSVLATVTELTTTENIRRQSEEDTTPDVKTSGRGKADETRGTSNPATDTMDANLTIATNETSSTENITAIENTGRYTTGGADRSATADVVTFTSFLEDSTLVTEVTTNTSTTTDYDVQSSKRQSHRTLILVLVSLMLCVLMVIVHLFLLKLRKAHYSWKKENETSDQTLESTKSRSNNEETSSQNKNTGAANAAPVNADHKVPTIQYNTQVSM
ncbi:cytotoxic and regulatory T-cell molecule isoform X2 [Hyla sarda]|uniref:cytotoxic and regulatory T-cell molecule isoform X2 n=1 Tax=Hyla sarda TaxID=327740 RepID=UPI0024C273EA|nr:cytotoxic and regulatory T-cell molecule isoform X2 [Hyla sarda]